jgi:hypothetical protein
MTGAIETLANQKAKSTFAEDLLELVRRYGGMDISDKWEEKKKEELKGNEGKEEETKMDVEGVEAREKEKIEKKMEMDEEQMHEKLENEDGWENVRSDGEDEREWEMVDATAF